MIWNMIRFLSVILIILLTCHAVLFFSWINFFNIQIYQVKLALLLILSFLSATFILSSVLIHLFNNTLTRTYYLLSGFWMGLLIFLLIVTALIWMVKGVLWCLPTNIPISIFIRNISLVLYSITFVYAGFCHYQFYKIKLRSVQVKILNLPEQWQGKKIVHLSDLHLGGAKHLSFLKKVVSLTNQQNADLIMITGDLFDGATNFQKRYMELLETLEAKDGVMFTSGNHEIYSGVETTRKLIEDSKIILLDNKAIVLDGLQILGISYPEFKNSASFDFNDQTAFKKGLPTILLYHTPTSIKGEDQNLTKVQSKDYLAPDTAFFHAREQGISLQLSGHTHAGQFLPYTWVTKKIFKGFHYGLHKIDDFYINISSGTGSWGPPLRSGYLSEIVIITLE